MAQHIQLGRTGEETAAEYLCGQGLIVLDRNWRCEYGEVDIVAREGNTLVFVEVKTRRSVQAGHPLEAITPAKLERMQQVAFEWMRGHPVHRGRQVRIDAVSVVMPVRGGIQVRHIEAVEL